MTLCDSSTGREGMAIGAVELSGKAKEKRCWSLCGDRRNGVGAVPIDWLSGVGPALSDLRSKIVAAAVACDP